MESFNRMKFKQSFSHMILLVFTLVLASCEPPPPHPQLQILDTAIRGGKLPEQIKALEILVKEGKPENQAGYQQSLDMIAHVKKLNQQAKTTLPQDKFAALDIAIKADNLRFNTESRAIIGDVLRPYLGFYDMLPRLQQWSYPELTKVVVAGVMPAPATRWQQPLTMPHTWPNNMLFTSLQTKESRLEKIWVRLNIERTELVEIVRLIGIMKNRAPDDDMLSLLYQDAIKLNDLYNLVLTDYQWHYQQQLLTAIVNANQQIIEDAAIAIKDKISNKQWLVDYELNKNIALDKLSGCCQYYLKQMQPHFARLESPNDYNQQMQLTIEKTNQLLNDNFTDFASPQAAIEQLTKHNQQIKDWLERIEALALQQPRKQTAITFLQTYYRWQQGDFQQLELLMPQLREYKNAVSRF